MATARERLEALIILEQPPNERAEYEILQWLWKSYQDFQTAFEVIPDLMAAGAEFTGALAENSDDDLLEGIDATLVFGSSASAYLLSGRYADFADDEEEAMLRHLDSLTPPLSAEEEALPILQYEIGQVLGCYTFHLLTLQDAADFISVLTPEQLAKKGINPEAVAEWLDLLKNNYKVKELGSLKGF